MSTILQCNYKIFIKELPKSPDIFCPQNPPLILSVATINKRKEGTTNDDYNNAISSFGLSFPFY